MLQLAALNKVYYNSELVYFMGDRSCSKDQLALKGQKVGNFYANEDLGCFQKHLIFIPYVGVIKVECIGEAFNIHV